MTTKTIIGEDHPDFVHRGEMPYVIDGMPEVCGGEDAPCLDFWEVGKIALQILGGIALGLMIFMLGRWSA